MPQSNPCVAAGLLPPDIYTANLDTQLTYPITFDFVDEADVVVFREQPEDTFTLLTNSAATGANPPNYTIDQGVSPALVTFAAGEPPGGVRLIIGRRTDICNPVVEYQVGAAIRAGDLNASMIQLLHLIQELRSTLGFIINGNDSDPIIPGEGVDLNDLDDVNVGDPVSPDPAVLRFNGSEWVGNAVIESTDAWVSNDESFATTAAGDQRWLNSDASDITGGPGIDVTAAANVVTIAADLTADGGLEFSGAGNDQEIRVDQGTGVVVNADGVNAGVTTVDVVNGPNDPDIRLTETLAGTVNNTDIGIIGGTGVSVTSSGDDITIAADATETVTRITAGTNITISPLTGVGNVTINSTGGGGSGDAQVVANCDALNTQGATDPDNGAAFLVQDSSNMTAAAGSSPGNDRAIVGLPTTIAAGLPLGGYGAGIGVTVTWDKPNQNWDFIRWAPSSPDLRYLNLDGATTSPPDASNIFTQRLTRTPLTIANNQDNNWASISYAANGEPEVGFGVTGTLGTCDFFVANLATPGTTDGRGVYINPGDLTGGNAGTNKFGQVRIEGIDNSASNASLLSQANLDITGTTTRVPMQRFFTNGNADIRGQFICNDIKLLKDSNDAEYNDNPGIGLQASPTMSDINYNLVLPLSGPQTTDTAIGSTERVMVGTGNANGVGNFALSWKSIPAAAAALWEVDSGNLQPVTNGQGIVIRNGTGTQTFGVTASNGQIQGASLQSAANASLTITTATAGFPVIFSAGIAATERPVPNGDGNWNIQDSQVWNVDAGHDITFPDNSPSPVVGQTGIFVLAGDVTWTNANGGTWSGAGGNLPTTNTAGTIVPFYVDTATSIRIGNPTSFS